MESVHQTRGKFFQQKANDVYYFLGARLRLHFDGYSDAYDFWENMDSANIFPVGWSAAHGQTLQPPKGFAPPASKPFSWRKYLEQTGGVAAPRECFPPRQKVRFSHKFTTPPARYNCNLLNTISPAREIHPHLPRTTLLTWSKCTK